MIKIKDCQLISLQSPLALHVDPHIMIAVQGPDLGPHRDAGDLLTADGTCYFTH